jgi:hypothetical protein
MVVDKLGREGMFMDLDLLATQFLLFCLSGAFSHAFTSTTYGSTNTKPTEKTVESTPLNASNMKI